MNYRIILSLLFLCGFSASNFASNTTTSAPDAESPPAIPGIAYVKQYCPAAEALTLSQDLWWTAPGDWKSDSQSFVAEIDRFIGAQWSGINIGKVICLYTGKGKANFPVALIRESLVPEPTGNLWSPNIQGQRNCQTNDVTDCPFLTETAKKTGQDVYKELEKFKGPSNSDNNSGQQ